MKLMNFFKLTWKKTAIALLLFFVFVFFHNLVYGLFIYFFGQNFWGANGDEPVFFILAVFGIPLYFLISIVYTLIIKFKKK